MTRSRTIRHHSGGLPRWLLPVALALLLLAPLLSVGIPMLQRAPADEQAMATFAAANRLYESGQTTLAQQAYNQLRNQGMGGVELLYNLALTQLQLQDIPGAHATLQEAARLAPRDAGIAALHDEVQAAALAQGFALPAANLTMLPLAPNEVAWLALLAWSVTSVLVVTALLARNAVARAASAILGALALGVTLFALMQLLP